MNRRELIQRAEHLIQWQDRQIDGLALNASRRNKLAAACFDMAGEHVKAIILLISRDLHGSAFALMRPLFESYVRGLWLHKVATDANLDRFANGKEPPKFAALCAAVEKLEAFKEGVLSTVQTRSWKAFCGFTHTGMEQVSRRVTAEFITANYDDDEVSEAINFACGIEWLAGIATCDVAENVNAANAIAEKVKALFPSKDQSVAGSA